MNSKVLPRRPRRRQRDWASARPLVILLAVAIVVVAGSLTLQQRHDPDAVSALNPGGFSLLEQMWTQRQEIPDRLVFPYSVVPGGVETPEEVLSAAQRDPLVAAHYRGFDFERALVTTLHEPRLAYVSYRLNGKIYWTRKKLTIAAGERVITDGTNYIRSRCGNRLIDAPQTQFSLLEPPEDVLNTPELPILALTMPYPGPPPEMAPPSETPAGVPPGAVPPDFYPPGPYPTGPTGGGFIIPPVPCCGWFVPPPPGTVPPPTTPPVIPPPPVTPPPVTPPPVTPPPVTPPPTTPPVNPPPVNPPPVNPPPVNPPPVNPPPVNPPPVNPPPVNPPPVNPPPVNPPPVNPPPVTPPPVNPPPVNPPPVTPPPVTPPPLTPPVGPPPVTPPPVGPPPVEPPPVNPPPVEPPPVIPPPNPIPEPSTYGLVAAGLAVLAWSARRRGK